MPDDDPLSYLTYGEETKGGYVNSLAYDLKPATTSGTPTRRTMPVLIYASLATFQHHGPQLSARGLAHLHRLTLWPTGIQLDMPKQLRYGLWTHALKSDLTHLLLAHPAGIASTVAPYRTFYLIRPPHDTEIPHLAPAAFFEFLNRTTTIPLKPTWTPFLWTLMQTESWVSLCPGYRSHVLRCDPDHAVLLTRIQDAIRARNLQ